DFCCCGTYKWLMGEFGTAFLYVRPDRLERLQRVEVGWRQILHQVSHRFPFDPPGPIGEDYELRNDAAGLFEVSTPGWGPLATAVGSLDYIQTQGVEAMARYRQPLIERLQAELPRRGLIALTPPDSRAPIVAFAYRNARKRWSARLAAEQIRVSLYPHRIRISVSVYNTMDDIHRLLDALAVQRDRAPRYPRASLPTLPT
ncbi:MAG: aminotransferase class V-fold PLP-dependent enzyme, partial [Steroidobacteraceae bacterium]